VIPIASVYCLRRKWESVLKKQQGVWKITMAGTGGAFSQQENIQYGKVHFLKTYLKIQCSIAALISVFTQDVCWAFNNDPSVFLNIPKDVQQSINSSIDPLTTTARIIFSQSSF